MNKFGDLTNREFRKTYLGFKPNFREKCGMSTCKKNASLIPESIDWREKGYVTPVKDQGKCGFVDKINSLIKKS